MQRPASVAATVLAVLTIVAGSGVAPAVVVSRWSGENNALDSVGLNHGTAEGGVGYGPGASGMGFMFDGVNDVVRVPSNATLYPTGDFSVDLYVRTTSTATATLALLYECGNTCFTSISASMYGFQWVNGRPVFVLRDGWSGGPHSGNITSTSGCIAAADDRFHRVTGVRDVGAMQARVYLEGNLVGAGPLAAWSDGPLRDDDGSRDDLLIGAKTIAGQAGLEQFFAGFLDEVQVVEGMLFEGAIGDEAASVALANGPQVVRGDDLVVAVGGSPGSPGGTVRLYEGTDVAGSASIASGEARVPTSGMARGFHTFTAVYEGDATFGVRCATFTVEIMVPTSLAAQPVVLEALPGVALNVPQLRALLTGDGGPLSGLPVAFRTGGTTLCAAALTGADGEAQCDLGPGPLLDTVLGLGYDASFGGAVGLLPSGDTAGLLTVAGEELP